MIRVTENLGVISNLLATAASEAGRDPRSVKLLAVSKRQPLDKILAAAVSNPGIVKIPSVYVQGDSGGFEGPAAILGASNLVQSIAGGSRDDDEQQNQSQ